MQSTVDVGHLLDHGEWTGFQKIVLALTALAIIFDGFDLQLIAFAIPALMKEWHVPRESFALVLAVGLLGMSLGTAAAGQMGDRIGRKRGLLLSLLVLGLATVACAFATGVESLAVWRFVAGAGLGGALPNATALTAEFTPFKRRAMAVSMTIVCIPLGGALAGAVAARTLTDFGWRYLFVCGGIAALGMTGLLLFLLPESARFLIRHRRRWPELERLLARLGSPVAVGSHFADPAEQRKETGTTIKALFGAPVLRNTLSLWLCFLSSMLSVYLALNWLPTYLAAQGFNLAAASSGGTAYNLGGVLGAFVCASFINRFGSRATLMTTCACASLTAMILWKAPPSPVSGLSLTAIAAHGFFANGTQTMLFALAAHIYPTIVRAGGVAYAISVGRLGAIVSAFLGATLVRAGTGRYFGVIAASLLVTVVGLALVSDHIPRFRAARGE